MEQCSSCNQLLILRIGVSIHVGGTCGADLLTAIIFWSSQDVHLLLWYRRIMMSNSLVSYFSWQIPNGKAAEFWGQSIAVQVRRCVFEDRVCVFKLFDYGKDLLILNDMRSKLQAYAVMEPIWVSTNRLCGYLERYDAAHIIVPCFLYCWTDVFNNFI